MTKPTLNERHYKGCHLLQLLRTITLELSTVHLMTLLAWTVLYSVPTDKWQFGQRLHMRRLKSWETLCILLRFTVLESILDQGQCRTYYYCCSHVDEIFLPITGVQTLHECSHLSRRDCVGDSVCNNVIDAVSNLKHSFSFEWFSACFSSLVPGSRDHSTRWTD